MGRILSLVITVLLLVSSITAQNMTDTDAPVVAPVAVPVTPLPTTLAPVVAVTPLPTEAPITGSPVSPAPTDPPLTAAPVSPQPTTTAPVVVSTPAPITPETVQPATPQPVTTAPVAVTPAPVAVTPAPVAVTPAPVAVTPAPVAVTIEPTTAAPVLVTTSPVTETPSAAPITSMPSATAATSEPSDIPTTPAPVTPAPVTSSPVTSAPVTRQPITSLPSFTPPSNVPSSLPSDLPSAGPSLLPSGAPSKGPTDIPVSAAPSGLPSVVPSSSPIMPVTGAPTRVKLNAEPVVGLVIVLSGENMTTLDPDAIDVWEATTKAWIEEFYNSNEIENILSGVASDVVTTITLTAQDPPGAASRRLSGRSLQSSVPLAITYTQQLSYVAETADVTTTQVVENPFVRSEERLAYTFKLFGTGNEAFRSLRTVSEVKFPPEPEDKGGLSTGAIIGIAVGGACGLLALIGGFVYFQKRSSNHTGYLGGVGDNPPTSIKAGQDDVSTLAEPGKMGAITSNESLAGYGEQSVATVDYDYSKAYGGGADNSVSSAGGTFGSNPQALGANQDAAVAAGAATLGSFSDDGSYGDAGGANVREELIDIYAPAGKLGVVIDTPDDGAPVVHAIKDSSVIADKLQVGDKLVAVDDEDVRTMTAIKVSKLISRKSGNPTRKLSIIRTTVVE